MCECWLATHELIIRIVICYHIYISILCTLLSSSYGSWTGRLNSLRLSPTHPFPFGVWLPILLTRFTPMAWGRELSSSSFLPTLSTSPLQVLIEMWVISLRWLNLAGHILSLCYLKSKNDINVHPLNSTGDMTIS